MNEVWKDVLDYKGLYSVSNMGRIRCDIEKRCSRKGKILKQSNFSHGYKGVGLFNGSNKKTITIHRIVATAFLCKKLHGMQVNHKNRIKDDNRLVNLEYVTPKQNVVHSFTTGNPRIVIKGENHKFSKLNNESVLEIRKMYSTKNFSHESISKIFKVSRSVVRDVIKKISWKHV